MKDKDEKKTKELKPEHYPDRIYKNVMDHMDCTFNMPASATIVHFDIQRTKPCFWYEFDPNEKYVKRTFRIVGTGQPIGRNEQYRGTLQDPPYVWHLYEAIDPLENPE